MTNEGAVANEGLIIQEIPASVSTTGRVLRARRKKTYECS